MASAEETYKILCEEFLRENGWCEGLIEQQLKNFKQIPYRFMILDDSGSMNATDGSTLMKTADGKFQSIKCSRWKELVKGVQFHAELANLAMSPIEFRLLNGAQPIVIGETQDDGLARAELEKALENGASGMTPLCKQVREVAEKVKRMAPQLKANGQKAGITIFTDGSASDGDVRAALRMLENEPCWVVIRLCTNEDDVGDYWDNVDKSIELQMDVLDDITGEAMEIYKTNPWLTYGEVMHRLREGACRVKIFDKLDESVLAKAEIYQAMPIILGGKEDDFPHPEVDMKGFIAAITTKQNQMVQSHTWDPLAKRMEPWIKTKKLGGGKCTIA
jgi:hypothetical protein